MKHFVLLVNFAAILLFSWFTDQDINVSMQVPEKVYGGHAFQVTLTIDKGDLESFSRYTQELPYGLTASRVSTANADFTFDDQRLRLIWLKLPADPKVQVTYDVNVDKRLKGSFSLSGEFSFIEQNERRSIEVNSGHEIQIIPDPTVPDSLLVDINDYERIVLPELRKGLPGEQLAVLRREPVKTGPHEITVELLVKKDNLDKFAKIEEYLPPGFRAVEGNSKGGIFSFSQGTAKILWMNLPPDQEFVVSYKIIPDTNKTLADLNISGSFSYISGNQSKTVAVEEKNFNLAEVSAGNDTSGNQVISGAGKNSESASVEGKTETQEQAVDISRPDSTRAIVETEPVTGNVSNILQPEPGIYYRVQLAAGHKNINIDRYFRKKKVSQQVKMEFHDGWRKYTAGSFNIYRDARDYRVKIWNTTPIDDAFVSAYNSGDRITVQEALMITNQKWYH